jgi:hypothetical protein
MWNLELNELERRYLLELLNSRIAADQKLEKHLENVKGFSIVAKTIPRVHAEILMAKSIVKGLL